MNIQLVTPAPLKINNGNTVTAPSRLVTVAIRGLSKEAGDFPLGVVERFVKDLGGGGAELALEGIARAAQGRGHAA